MWEHTLRRELERIELLGKQMERTRKIADFCGKMAWLFFGVLITMIVQTLLTI